jgi:hypothetical protein
MRGCKVGRDLLTPPEVYFVGCLASEGCMWNYGVVLLDVECDQLLKDSEAVEGMQVEPAMLERPPPCFDHGIGIADLDLGEYAAQLSETKKVVDLVIDVLDARVGDHSGRTPREPDAAPETGRRAMVTSPARAVPMAPGGRPAARIRARRLTEQSAGSGQRRDTRANPSDSVSIRIC